MLQNTVTFPFSPDLRYLKRESVKNSVSNADFIKVMDTEVNKILKQKHETIRIAKF